MDSIDLTAQELSGSRGPHKGELWEKIISPSLFESRCSDLEQTVVAVGSYTIAVLAFYSIPSIAVQTDC